MWCNVCSVQSREREVMAGALHSEDREKHGWLLKSFLFLLIVVLFCFVSFKWLHVPWLDFHNLCPSVGVTVTESPLFLKKLHHTLET